MNSKDQKVFIYKKDQEYDLKQSCDMDMIAKKQAIQNQILKSENHYLERYADQIMNQLKKESKVSVNNVRINPSKKIDLKSKMLREYMQPDKNKKYKDIDMK